MKLRPLMMSVVLALAAGCDTMDQDVDSKAFKIDDSPVVMNNDKTATIDLGARIVYPGTVTVQITMSTKHGDLRDLGKGILQYTPLKGSLKDAFGFKVFNSANRVLGEDTIGIVIPGDSTSNPPDSTHVPIDSLSHHCREVLAQNDSVKNVTTTILVDVTANDSTCMGSLTVTIDVPPTHGTATVIGNKIQYTPFAGFTNRDKLLYKVTSDSATLPGYALVVIYGTDPDCVPVPQPDLFYKPINDTTVLYMNVLANDMVCDSTIDVVLGQSPRYGQAWFDKTTRRIGYRNNFGINNTDSVMYNLCGGNSDYCNYTWVVIKRN